jgi:hypothetical protein
MLAIFKIRVAFAIHLYFFFLSKKVYFILFPVLLLSLVQIFNKKDQEKSFLHASNLFFV